MAQQASLASAGSSIQTKPIKGFGKLGRHVNSLLSDMKRAEVVAGLNTSISATPQGRSINSRASAGGAAGAAGDKTLYFIENGVLYTGVFSVANITAV